MIRGIALSMVWSAIAVHGLLFAQGSYGVEGSILTDISLKVDTENVARTPIVIKIDRSELDGRILITTKDTVIPTEMGFDSSGKLRARSLITAVGVSWMFVKAGISFVADGKKYTAEKAGATIRFTRSGVQMDGIEEPGPFTFTFLFSGLGLLLFGAVIAIIISRGRRGGKPSSTLN